MLPRITKKKKNSIIVNVKQKREMFTGWLLQWRQIGFVEPGNSEMVYGQVLHNVCLYAINKKRGC